MITTGFMMLLIATGAALVAVLILSIGATVAEEAEAKERIPQKDTFAMGTTHHAAARTPTTSSILAASTNNI